MRPPLDRRVAHDGVVAAAARVFGRRGLAATRVEDLLAAAGIARRTFYKYFQSKEDVLAALYDLATSELLSEMRAAAGAKGDPFAAILHGLDTYLDYHVDNAPLLRVLVAEAIRADSPLAPARRRFRGELATALGAAARAASGGAVAPHDPMLYLALVSALEGLSLDLLEEGGSPKRGDIRRAKAVMRLLLRRALAPPADAPRRAR